MPPSTPDPTLWLTNLMAKQQELLKSLAPPGTPAAADPANPLAPWMQAANAFTQWQQQALQQLTQGLSPRHREAIENYFRNLAAVKQR